MLPLRHHTHTLNIISIKLIEKPTKAKGLLPRFRNLLTIIAVNRTNFKTKQCNYYTTTATASTTATYNAV